MDAPFSVSAAAVRQGKKLLYTFNEVGSEYYADVKVCVEFAGSKRPACEEIIDRDW